MQENEPKTLLKAILSSYDQLGHLRRRIDEDQLEPAKIEGLRRAARRKINEIGRNLKAVAPDSPLFELIDRYALNKYQVVIVLGLLKQRLTSETPQLTGREILGILYDSSYGVLQGVRQIDETSALVSTGIILPEPSDTSARDILDTRFRLSERVYRLVLNMFTERDDNVKVRLKDSGVPYKNNYSYLFDLRKLSLLYRKRATRVFSYDYWDEIGLGVSESVSAINKQIDALRKSIESKLEKTENEEKLHSLRFAKGYNLSEEEIIILVTLLFQELTEGNAYVGTVDLLKLVSQNEEDLVKKRGFFSRRTSMIKNQLIVLEDMVNKKELTGEVFMPNWAIDLLLQGKTEGEGEIDVDARLDFHNYLKNLESSEDFFDNLDP
jgi:hypothetical protein